MEKSIAVLGLGRFGKRVVEKLIDLDADVLIADNDEEVIAQYAENVSYAITADLSSPETIKALGIGNMDVVIVAMGSSSLEASIMCIMVAKELGVPKVISTAADERMGEIYTKVGADEIIYPEEESAVRTVRKVLSSNFLDYFSIGNDLAVANIRPMNEWIGRSLKELDLPGKFGINVFAVKQDGKVNARISPDLPLQASMELMIIAAQEVIDKMSQDR